MKSQKRKLRVGIAILGALLLIVLWISLPSKSLPSYNGKTVEEWFYGKDWHPGKQKTIEAARIAFKAMGTTCIPFLLETAKVNETPFNRLYCEIHPTLPPFLRERISAAIPASYIQMISVDYLGRLKPQELDPFVPELMEIVPTIKNKLRREQAFEVVNDLALRIDNVETKKNYFLPFLRDPSFNIKFKAAVALSEIDNTITNGIPTLTTVLTNRSLFGSTFEGVLYSIGTQRYNEVIDGFQRQAHNALANINPELAIRYEIQ